MNDPRINMGHHGLPPPPPIPSLHGIPHVHHIPPIPPMLTPGGDSSDQDMDIAINANHQQHIATLGQMPPIQQQQQQHQHQQQQHHDNTNNSNSNSNGYYPNVTAFNKSKKPKHKNGTKRHRDKSPKKPNKKARTKTKKKAKVSNCTLTPSQYQDISVNVPALNKMNVSPSKIHNSATSNGRKVPRVAKRRPKPSHTNGHSHTNGDDEPVVRDSFDDTNNRNNNNAKDVSIPPAITNLDQMEGQMEVAYSQQYPQVGFPYIYKSDAEKGKKFTCKFMDASSMIDGVPGFCDRQFGQKCHWMRHCLEKHVPTEMSQRYQCRYCNMKYAQNSSLKEHVAICHSNKPPSFKCPYCTGDITFTRWTSVLRHCRNQHPDQEEPKKQLRVKHNRKKKDKDNVNGNGKGGGRRKGRKKKNVDTTTLTTNNRMDDNMMNDNNCDDNDYHDINNNHNININNNHNNMENTNNMMDIDDNLPPMNIMPSVNMNISMNQMLSNHPNYIANVAILPPNHNNHNHNVNNHNGL